LVSESMRITNDDLEVSAQFFGVGRCATHHGPSTPCHNSEVLAEISSVSYHIPGDLLHFYRHGDYLLRIYRRHCDAFPETRRLSPSSLSSLNNERQRRWWWVEWLVVSEIVLEIELNSGARLGDRHLDCPILRRSWTWSPKGSISWGSLECSLVSPRLSK
jgi:hypothetical protein